MTGMSDARAKAVMSLYTPEQLARMPREQMMELLELTSVAIDRAKKRTPPYSPNDGQIQIHKSEASERYVFCGNGFGKTALMVNEVHWAAVGFNPITGQTTPVPAKIVVLLDSPDKIEELFIPEYRKWNRLLPDQLSKKGKPYYSVIDYDNGSRVTFLSHNVEELKLEGIEMTHLFLDEPPQRRMFIALTRGGRIKGRQLQVLMTATPIMSAWMRREIYEPWGKGELVGVECFKYKTEVNRKNLAEGYIERFRARLSEKEARVRLDGEFFDLEGLALADTFDRRIHIIPKGDFKWERLNPCVIAIDPHPRKPIVASLLGADKDNYKYYIKELARKATPREFCKELKLWMDGYRIVDIVVDSLGSAPMTGGEGFKSFIEVANDEGVRCRATTYDDKNDEAFIERIQDALYIPDQPNNFNQKLPNLRIVEGNNGIVTDIESVEWMHDRKNDMNKPKLEITNRDFLSTLKYGLAANLTFHKGHTRIIRRPLPSSYGHRR